MKIVSAFDLVPESLAWMGAIAHPFYVLGLIAFLSSIVAGVVYMRVSKQEELGAITREIKTAHLEMALNLRYLGELPAIQKKIIVLNFKYLQKALLPICVVLVPMVCLLISLDSFFAYRPIAVGDIFSIAVKMTSGKPAELRVAEAEIEGARLIETDPLLHRAVFRSVRDGEFEIPLEIHGMRVSKKIVVGDGIKKITAVKKDRGFLDAVYGFENEDLPSGVESVSVDYALLKSPVSFFGWRPDWLAFFVIVSLSSIVILKQILDIK